MRSTSNTTKDELLAPWDPRPWGARDLTREVSVMADEGYKLQVSTKVGKTMVNLRSDDVDEFDLLLKNLSESDNPVSNAIAKLIVDELVEEEKPAKKSKPKKKTTSKKSKDEDDEDDEDDDEGDDDDDEEEEEEDDDAPTKLQLELGKKLKIKGYKDMTKDELKKAIKKKKAKKS